MSRSTAADGQVEALLNRIAELPVAAHCELVHALIEMDPRYEDIFAPDDDKA